MGPVLRLQRIAGVLIRHGFSEVVTRIGLAMPGIRSEGSEGLLGQRLARVLADLGPTFIKLGQVLSTREDLFPPDITGPLGSLQSGSAPLKSRLICRSLEKALGIAPAKAFAIFEEAPLASASIGQVHRARLQSGEEVVVKVQRPGVASLVAADIALMRGFAGLLAAAFEEIASLEPLALIDAFERGLQEELDFRIEARNFARLSELLRGAREVRLPRVYDEFTRSTVLVLEYLPGRRINALSPEERCHFRGALLRAFGRQIFDHGVFHADPHLGNLLALDDGRLALLDLGAVAVITPRLRRALIRTARTVALRQRRGLARAVLALAPPRSQVDCDRLAVDLEALLQSARNGQDGRVLAGAFSILRVHRLGLPPALLSLMRAVALLDGTVRSLAPKADLVRDLRREFLRSFVRRVFGAPWRWLRRFGVWLLWGP